MRRDPDLAEAHQQEVSVQRGMKLSSTAVRVSVWYCRRGEAEAMSIVN